MKKKHWIIIFGALALLIAFIFIDSKYIRTNRIVLRKETIRDQRVPESFDGKLLLYFNDLDYNDIVDEDYLNKVVNMINTVYPDIVVFGGDLIDTNGNDFYDENVNAILIEALSRIEAPLGKFAVMGDIDLESNQTTTIIENIYRKSGFELLRNDHTQIRVNNDDYINLIGIDPLVNGNPDLESSFYNLKPNSYNLVICHTPDIADSLTESDLAMVLSGHSHNNQTSLPLIGPLSRSEGALKYHHGRYRVGSITLDVSDGVGMSGEKIRLFSDNEIVVYKFVK